MAGVPPTMARVSRMVLLVTLLLAGVALVVLALCGGRDEGLDRSDPVAVFERAMEAVHDADWSTLKTLLTKEARLEMERDLDRLKRRLGHPDDGKIERAMAHERLGEADAEAIRSVVEGGYPEALSFYVRIMPRERSPKPRGMEVTQYERKILYASADGTLRPVRLVRIHDAWYVADLQL